MLYIPWFRVAWATVSSTNNDIYGELKSVTYNGTVVPIYLGFKIAVQKHISINIEPLYQIATFNGGTSTGLFLDGEFQD